MEGTQPSAPSMRVCLLPRVYEFQAPHCKPSCFSGVKLLTSKTSASEMDLAQMDLALRSHASGAQPIVCRSGKRLEILPSMGNIKANGQETHTPADTCCPSGAYSSRHSITFLSPKEPWSSSASISMLQESRGGKGWRREGREEVSESCLEEGRRKKVSGTKGSGDSGREGGGVADNHLLCLHLGPQPPKAVCNFQTLCNTMRWP